MALGTSVDGGIPDKHYALPFITSEQNCSLLVDLCTNCTNLEKLQLAANALTDAGMNTLCVAVEQLGVHPKLMFVRGRHGRGPPHSPTHSTPARCLR